MKCGILMNGVVENAGNEKDANGDNARRKLKESRDIPTGVLRTVSMSDSGENDLGR